MTLKRVVPRGATSAMMMEDTRRQVTTAYYVVKDLKLSANLIVDDILGARWRWEIWFMTC